jgi:arylsulfatase A-like enzyme
MVSLNSDLIKPNILFLIFDSFRADKISGPDKNSLTPNFDYIKKNGVFFDHVVSSSDASLLSYAGLFSGKHPFKTGMRSSKLTGLIDTTSYLEFLKNHGYKLYGCMPKSSSFLEIIPEFANNEEAFLDYGMSVFTDAGRITLDKLNSKMKEPWLFIMHTGDLHFPITNPKGFEDEKFGSNNYEKQISAIDSWLGQILGKIDLEKTLVVIIGDHGSYIQALSKESLNVDFQDKGELQMKVLKISNKFPKFLEPLKLNLFLARENINRKRKEKKIKDLDLKPHEIRGLLHQRSNLERFLFDEKVRVPLFMIGPKADHGMTISQQVRLIDVFPTICEIIGIPDKDEKIDGVSLYPLLENKKMGTLIAYMESSPAILIQPIIVIGIRTDKYKYFRNRYDSSKNVHLYDLENDPYEDDNIADKDKNIVEAMEDILKKIISGFSLEKGCSLVDSDEELGTEESSMVEKQLKKMGYI